VPDYTLSLKLENKKEELRQFIIEHSLEAKFSEENEVELTLKEEEIPKVLSALNREGFHFLNIDIKKPSLEDVFLKIARS